MWRIAEPTDDDAIVKMCLQLYCEDPGPLPVTAEHMRTSLAALRREPWRGRTVVLELQGQLSGYALLISFWSNELGGEVCEVDELFVVSERRNKGHGTTLFKAIARGNLWPAGPLVAIALGVTRDNINAKRLYERLGFDVAGVSMVKRLRTIPMNLQ